MQTIRQPTVAALVVAFLFACHSERSEEPPHFAFAFAFVFAVAFSSPISPKRPGAPSIAQSAMGGMQTVI